MFLALRPVYRRRAHAFTHAALPFLFSISTRRAKKKKRCLHLSGTKRERPRRRDATRLDVSCQSITILDVTPDVRQETEDTVRRGIFRVGEQRFRKETLFSYLLLSREKDMAHTQKEQFTRSSECRLFLIRIPLGLLISSEMNCVGVFQSFSFLSETFRPPTSQRTAGAFSL